MRAEYKPLPEAEYKERELLTTLTLSNGARMEVRMPLTDDILPFAGHPEFGVLLACAATNLSRTEYGRLPFMDGFAILGPLNSYIEGMQKYNEPYNTKRRGEPRK